MGIQWVDDTIGMLSKMRKGQILARSSMGPATGLQLYFSLYRIFSLLKSGLSSQFKSERVGNRLLETFEMP